MLFMDMPDVPPQYTPVIVAQASQAKQQGAERTIGVCHPIENKEESRLSAVNAVSPVGEAMLYIENFEHKKFNKADFVSIYNAAKMTLLQAPKHGELELDDKSKIGGYFSSNYTYEGPDSATVLVEVGGYKVKVIYHFVLMSDVPGGGEQGTATDNKRICPNGYIWKISSTLDADGNSTITAIDYLPSASSTTDTLTSTSLNDWLGLAQLDGKIADLSGINVSFADLPSGAVGQTTGTNITLDTNAAGYNWFIDTTPADNSEYLPTANPNEWVAKEGTAAYGKMDMLSVLLHEYGHALGIDHSADNHDYMATTLTPGVRRMPSTDEMAMMQQLVAQAKDGLASNNTQDNAPTPFPTLPFGTTLSLAFLGRLRSSRYGDLSIAPDYATLTTKYAVAANATFANLATPAGWNTQGSVDIASGTGSATLNEVSTSQTRLSQVFMLNERRGVRSCIPALAPPHPT